MRNVMQQLKRSVCGLCVMTLAGGLAIAQTKPWTTVGSAGTVDEDDVNEVRFVQGEAQAESAAAVGTVSTIRYNVVATNDLGGLAVPRLTVRYRTGDGTGRVIVRLKRYNYAPGGAAVVMVEFDSQDHPATGSAYTTRSIVGCSSPSFDFTKNAYFVEVEFRKNGVNGQPGLGVVKVDMVPICVV